MRCIKTENKNISNQAEREPGARTPLALARAHTHIFTRTLTLTLDNHMHAHTSSDDAFFTGFPKPNDCVRISCFERNEPLLVNSLSLFGLSPLGLRGLESGVTELLLRGLSDFVVEGPEPEPPPPLRLLLLLLLLPGRGLSFVRGLFLL